MLPNHCILEKNLRDHATWYLWGYLKSANYFYALHQSWCWVLIRGEIQRKCPKILVSRSNLSTFSCIVRIMHCVPHKNAVKKWKGCKGRMVPNPRVTYKNVFKVTWFWTRKVHFPFQRYSVTVLCSVLWTRNMTNREIMNWLSTFFCFLAQTPQQLRLVKYLCICTLYFKYILNTRLKIQDTKNYLVQFFE